MNATSVRLCLGCLLTAADSGCERLMSVPGIGPSAARWWPRTNDWRRLDERIEGLSAEIGVLACVRLPSKADIQQWHADVRQVPQADINPAILAPVGAAESKLGEVDMTRTFSSFVLLIAVLCASNAIAQTQQQSLR